MFVLIKKLFNKCGIVLLVFGLGAALLVAIPTNTQKETLGGTNDNI